MFRQFVPSQFCRGPRHNLVADVPKDRTSIVGAHNWAPGSPQRPLPPKRGGLLSMHARPKPSTNEEKSWAAYHAQWETIWQTQDNGKRLKIGQTFDKGQHPPILDDILKRGIIKVEGKRCLVPGCGRGYDAIALARAGASEVVGLDFSRTAIEEAYAFRDSPAAALDEATQAKIRYDHGDFFTYDDKMLSGWDVAFDHTFFCALRKDMRTSWGETYSRLVAHGGDLVCLMYPVDQHRDPDSGPPFRVDIEAYVAVLAPHGFRLAFLEQVPDELANKDRRGMEWIGVFHR